MRRALVSLLILLTFAAHVHASRTFADATWLQVDAALMTGVPLTMCAWVRPTVVNVAQDLMGLARSSGDNHRIQLQINTSGQAQAVAVDTAVGAATLASPTVVAGAWSLICGVFTTTTSRAVYLNGSTNTATNTTAITPTSLARTYVARAKTATGNQEFNGEVGPAMFWNEALAPAEIDALARGAYPQSIRPHALVSCPHIYGEQSPETDDCGPMSWAVNGAPAKASTRPPVGRFHRGR